MVPRGSRPPRRFQPVVGSPRNARLFALLSMALANCYILDWDAKFHYQFWRPITAIRNGDQDGNDATERDAGWLPLNATPMHPEYPSQAGINAGAARGILEAVFGTGPEGFTVTDALTRDCSAISTTSRRWGKSKGGAHLGRHPLQEFAERGRRDGTQARRLPRRELHEAADAVTVCLAPSLGSS